MILITGGAGFIGSHATLRLQELGFKTVVIDDLSQGDRRAVLAGEFVEGNFGDQKVLKQIFTQYPIEAIFHFAAFIDVGESVRFPEKYYHNNVTQTEALLESAQKAKVAKFIFSSTAAVYGNPQHPRIAEDHPTQPINPYGASKLLAEKRVQESGLDWMILRYFNAAGGDPKGRLKNFKKKESNLIPAALRAVIQETPVTLFGENYPTPDGTCIRDYIHVWDLAEAHFLAYGALERGSSPAIYNLGNGEGYSVKKVLNEVDHVTKTKLQVVVGDRRPGDPAVLMADATKAREQLNWIPQYPELNKIVRDAWQALSIA